LQKCAVFFVLLLFRHAGTQRYTSLTILPIRTEVQPNGRIRHWGYVPEMGQYLRVVTEPDGKTVHNAFFDRRFKP
jgi:hypothetical protein